MLCSVCFVFISVLLLERHLETAGPGGAAPSAAPASSEPRDALTPSWPGRALTSSTWPRRALTPQGAAQSPRPSWPPGARQVPQLRGERCPGATRIQLSVSSPKDSFVFRFVSFPEFRFRLTTIHADTAPLVPWG